MHTLRWWLGAALASALALLGVGLALAQSAPGAAHLLAPLVVDVAQDVPVEVVLAVPVDGEVVTVTAPITVSLALQVRLAGANVLTAATAADAPPVAVAVSELPPATSSRSRNNVVGGLAWRILGSEDLGQSFTHSVDDYTTKGQFLRLTLELEGVGNLPVDIGQEYYDSGLAFVLQDERGRIFAPFDLNRHTGEECEAVSLNPGLPIECTVVYELPAQVGALSLLVGNNDGEKIALPLP